MEQYVKYPPMTERQIELMQERLFRESGPFFYFSIPGLTDSVIPGLTGYSHSGLDPESLNLSVWDTYTS